MVLEEIISFVSANKDSGAGISMSFVSLWSVFVQVCTHASLSTLVMVIAG